MAKLQSKFLTLMMIICHSKKMYTKNKMKYLLLIKYFQKTKKIPKFMKNSLNKTKRDLKSLVGEDLLQLVNFDTEGNQVYRSTSKGLEFIKDNMNKKYFMWEIKMENNWKILEKQLFYYGFEKKYIENTGRNHFLFTCKDKDFAVKRYPLTKTCEVVDYKSTKE